MAEPRGNIAGRVQRILVDYSTAGTKTLKAKLGADQKIVPTFIHLQIASGVTVQFKSEGNDRGGPLDQSFTNAINAAGVFECGFNEDLQLVIVGTGQVSGWISWETWHS